ncbi:MAG: nickel pincer cofactor biosynthesis protein LarC [Verrucomicrobia bacterium]|nr:nickel pincer cofactor biosynthesis protein LarC [Verrucomicrobiota bacterium]
MKTLYLDIFSGISGDMFLGAMIDLGVDFHTLESELAKLGLHDYHLHATKKHKANILGVKFDVHLADHHEDEEHDPDEDSHHPHDHGSHHHHHAGSHHQEDEHHSHEHGHETGHGLAQARHGARETEHDHEEEHHHHHHTHSRDYSEIRAMISQSGLSEWVRQKAVAVFHRIAVAEGKIHGELPDRVHFHEVGAVDSIVDIVGACLALEMLGRPRVLAGPAVEGTGWVNCAHGRFPIPTLATLEILGERGIAVTQCDEPHELITPTGAAILAEFAESFGSMQGLVARKVGYGLGTRDNQIRPNVLRAVLGDSMPSTSADASGAISSRNDWETDTIAVLETNLDDSHPEILGYFVERAISTGALDVFHTPIQMKKNRPGVLLTVLCSLDRADAFSEMLLRETSAFGVRRYTAERRKLRREQTKVKTRYGEVAVKLGKLNGQTVHATPEFEACKKLAAEAQVPLTEIYQAAQRALKL